MWSIVEAVVESETGFKAFHASFLKATEPAELDAAHAAESLISKRLVDLNLVTPDDVRLTRWRDRVEQLRGNEDKLVRIFRNIEGFDLPYDYQLRDEIQDVWDSLFGSLELKQKSSFVARKIEDAEETGDLDMLLLSEEEKGMLRRELS